MAPEAKKHTASNPFAIFKQKQFTIFAIAHFFAIVSLWASRIAIDWLVLELTGSPVQVGIVSALQFLPMLCFGFLGGVVSDVISKKKILVITNLISAALLIFVGLEMVIGNGSVLWLYFLSLAIGLLTIVDNPARQVIVGELVDEASLAKAVTMNSSIFQTGALSGPAISGVLLTVFDGGYALLAMSGISICSAILILLLNPVQRSKLVLKKDSLKTDIFGGFSYVKNRPYLIWALMMTLTMSALSRNMPVILTDYANEIFHSGAGGYAVMNTIIASGGLIGIMSLSFFGKTRLRGIVLVMTLLGVFCFGAAFLTIEAPFLSLLLLIGGCQFIFGTAVNTFIQTNTEVAFRGRVLSLMTSLFIGGQAIGGPIVGLLTEKTSGQIALGITGLLLVLAAALFSIFVANRLKKKANRGI